MVPKYFNNLSEFRVLITKHNCKEVILSLDDFNFLYERAEPNTKGPGRMLRITNNNYEIVEVRTSGPLDTIIGSLDLTKDLVGVGEERQRVR